MLEASLNGTSLDLVSENVKKLKILFPEIVTEDKIDFAMLQAVLGQHIDHANERYSFTWQGKVQALRLSQTPSTGTLLPCQEESKDWDTTQNLYLEGDNLEVLKLLQKAYHNKVKAIYIDPPYNTGNDFVYSDDYRDNLENYLRLTGQKTEDGLKLSTNSEKAGRYHTNWLNMMYPRLRLARNLLTDDGVIFISIDDNELDNVKKLCNEVFGENNFIDIFSWVKTETPANLSKKTKKAVEYILCYEKNKNDHKFKGLRKESKSSNGLLNQSNAVKRLVFPKQVVDTSLADGVYQAGQYGTSSYKIILLEDTEVKDGYFTKDVILEANFKWGQDKLNKEIEAGTKISIKTIAFSPSYEKKEYEPEVPWNLINRSFNVKTNEEASKELERLFGFKVFDYPKPVSLVKYLLNFNVGQHDVVLDFFSGSATTAQAVLQLNAEDGGNRRFIMAQLPEPCALTSEAVKVGYKNICEIGKERIRRAGAKMKAEQGSAVEGLDIGFKVFKLASSNFKKWNPDLADLQTSLEDMISNYVQGRTEMDVVYEIMLKYGIDLAVPMEEYDVNGKKLYSLGFGSLVICLDDDITTALIDSIIQLKDKLAPEKMRVVFKDNGFRNDAVKTNSKEILKQARIGEFVTI
ncbi:adenine-specific DNA-methyltransferase [Desulforamulus aeronauticus DSM 10349]|uniref:Adenine-specific DNA-methyltransferase n=2 Tax=Desulforamulus aeronauticus TaxID=53343 RepID=A0A1M6NYN7_9FIRM|nr:site-specific DNA-methyltransferase [Desulforamulus aeronauticus]SHK00752.1 adenine-specific DNA-methyltransferase [Desulforamulus aeronauticus DSM 10349]